MMNYWKHQQRAITVCLILIWLPVRNMIPYVSCLREQMPSKSDEKNVKYSVDRIHCYSSFPWEQMQVSRHFLNIKDLAVFSNSTMRMLIFPIISLTSCYIAVSISTEWRSLAASLDRNKHDFIVHPTYYMEGPLLQLSH